MKTTVPSQKSIANPPPPADGDAAENDAIVGRAFWWSLAAIGLLAIAFGGGYLIFSRRAERPATVPAAVTGATDKRERIAVPPVVRFVDVAQQAGIDFQHLAATSADTLFPEVMGGGVAVLDYNTDGRLDLLFLNETHMADSPEATTGDQPWPALYRNDGDWKFTDVTREAGLGHSYYGMGAAVGDYDNDGDPDLYLTAVGPCRLLKNEGGVFRDLTDAAGIAGGREDWTTSAGWFDYDVDGDLDLLVCTYVRWSRQANLDRIFRPQGGVRGSLSPQSFDGSTIKLYRNEGRDLFSDVSQQAGVEILNADTGAAVAKALGICFTDLNDDGWTDFLIANDTVRNFAFLNEKNGRFTECGREIGVAFGPLGESRQGMGIDAADFRNNRTLGVAIGNFAGETTALFVSSKTTAGKFSDEATTAGIGADTRPMLTFGLYFFDYDLDGRLDLLSANGHVVPDIEKVVSGQSYAQPTQLFWNCGGQTDVDFAQVTAAEAGPDLFQPIVGRGAVYGDLDGDHDLDCVIAGIGSRPLVLRNDQQLAHHWVRLKLVGQESNRDAIGACVELKVDGTWRRAMVTPTKSYLSQCEPELTFGLGTATSIEEARVIWPGGRVQVLSDLPLDARAIIEEQVDPEGRATSEVEQ